LLFKDEIDVDVDVDVDVNADIDRHPVVVVVQKAVVFMGEILL